MTLPKNRFINARTGDRRIRWPKLGHLLLPDALLPETYHPAPLKDKPIFCTICHHGGGNLVKTDANQYQHEQCMGRKRAPLRTGK